MLRRLKHPESPPLFERDTFKREQQVRVYLVRQDETIMYTYNQKQNGQEKKTDTENTDKSFKLNNK